MVTITSTSDCLIGDWCIRLDGIIVYSDPDIFKVLRIARKHDLI